VITESRALLGMLGAITNTVKGSDPSAIGLTEKATVWNPRTHAGRRRIGSAEDEHAPEWTGAHPL